MNQNELTNRISQHTDLTPRQVESVLAALATVTQEALAAGERVQVPGLAVADTAMRAERTGRNPRTGEPITIPAHRAVRITPAAALKRAVAS